MRSTARRLALGVALAAFVVGCPLTPPPAPEFQTPAPAGGLSVRLRFDEGADLDLFVTDPDQETLYFGNNPTRSGGELDRDLRCDAALDRSETARYLTPLSGVYRVAVGYDRSCRFRRRPVGYTVEVRLDLEPASATSLPALVRSGTIAPGRFESRALEFRVTDEPPISLQPLPPEPPPRRSDPSRP